MKLAELIEKLGGTLAQGTASTELIGVANSNSATPTDLVFAEDPASAAQWPSPSSAGALVLKPNALDSYAANPTIAIVEAAQPRLWFAKAAKLLKPAPSRIRFSLNPTTWAPTSNSEKTFFLGPGAVIGSHAAIGCPHPH